MIKSIKKPSKRLKIEDEKNSYFDSVFKKNSKKKESES